VQRAFKIQKRPKTRKLKNPARCKRESEGKKRRGAGPHQHKELVLGDAKKKERREEAPDSKRMQGKKEKPREGGNAGLVGWPTPRRGLKKGGWLKA